MTKTKLTYILLILLLIGVVGAYFLTKPTTTVSNVETHSLEAPLPDTLLIFNEGRRTTSLFGQLHSRGVVSIETLASTCNDSYKAIVPLSKVSKLRSKGYVVELLYSTPKDLKVPYLTEKLSKTPEKFTKIVVPLDSTAFPEGVVFLFTSEIEFYTLSLPSESKSQLKDIVKNIELT